MAYFGENTYSDKPLEKRVGAYLQCMGFPVQNAPFLTGLDDEETDFEDEVTYCRSIYITIGILESMLDAASPRARKQSLSEASDFFDGTFEEERRKDLADRFAELIREAL